MLNSDSLSGLAILALSFIGYYQSKGFSYFSKIFVLWVLIILAMLGGALLIKGLMRPETLKFWSNEARSKRLGLTVLILTGYAALLPIIGFILASIMMFFSLSLLLTDPTRRRSARMWISTLAISCIIPLLFELVFRHALLVPLPVGRIFLG